MPGVQASVRAGRFTWSGAGGYVKDLSAQASLDTTDILRIGSITKTFTADVVLKPSERGLVKLDDPLRRWFPNLPHMGEGKAAPKLAQDGSTQRRRRCPTPALR